jgi:hypothetical protein
MILTVFVPRICFICANCQYIKKNDHISWYSIPQAALSPLSATPAAELLQHDPPPIPPQITVPGAKLPEISNHNWLLRKHNRIEKGRVRKKRPSDVGVDPAQPMATADQTIIGGVTSEKLLQGELPLASGLQGRCGRGRWTENRMRRRSGGMNVSGTQDVAMLANKNRCGCSWHRCGGVIFLLFSKRTFLQNRRMHSEVVTATSAADLSKTHL